MKKSLILACTIILLSIGLYAQKFNLQRIDPPNWWVGMKHHNPQLLVYGEDINAWQPSIDYEGVTLMSTERVDNPNYLFLNLDIGARAQPGTMTIHFSKGKKEYTVDFPLLAREHSDDRVQGLTPEDFIYLVFPDRFANGDPDNDVVAGMNDMSHDRSNLYARHGGDLQGIIDHLDYLKDLGVTAIWPNPLIENNEAHDSYHGYAATDLYKVDPRLGTNALYKEFVEKAHKKGMKVVMDIIHNHMGDQAWFIRNPPMASWVHQWPEFTRTTYRAPTMMDPHASQYDRKKFNSGWFDKHMPDLNQSDPYLATYLIQNNIWWIEYTGLDAFRMDTYSYSDPEFLTQWGQAIMEEYPQFFMFGETWVHGVGVQAFFNGQTNIDKDFNAHMPSLTDFQLYYAINDALNKEQGWTDGISKLYYTLAQDYLFKDPSQNVVFLDNHDLSRFYSVVGEDFDKYKMGIGWLMTVRGIPNLYYGTEILMKNYSDGHGGSVREDFPGGWANDSVNKFTAADRNAQEQKAFEYVKKLANWRKSNPVVYAGKLMQFVPEDGVYVYFRYTDTEAVMIIMNTKEGGHDLAGLRYWEILGHYQNATDVVTGQELNSLNNFHLPGHSITILQLGAYTKNAIEEPEEHE